jgi:hypothetical protein
MRSVYSQALQRGLQVAIGFAGEDFPLPMWEDEIVLRQKLEMENGLKHENGQHDRAKPTTATAEKEIISGEAVKT